MTLEEEIINTAGKRLADEIDFEILCGMLKELGWKKIVLSPMTHEQSCEIDDWTEQHVKGSFETMGLVWIFELEEDANWFALRWL